MAGGTFPTYRTFNGIFSNNFIFYKVFVHTRYVLGLMLRLQACFENIIKHILGTFGLSGSIVLKFHKTHFISAGLFSSLQRGKFLSTLNFIEFELKGIVTSVRKFGVETFEFLDNMQRDMQVIFPGTLRLYFYWLNLFFIKFSFMKLLFVGLHQERVDLFLQDI